MNVLKLKWRKNGHDFEKDISKDAFFEIFNAIKNGDFSTVEVSTKICNICPPAKELYIDYDRRTQNSENPLIVFTDGSGKQTPIQVKNFHKIVWSILENLCR